MPDVIVNKNGVFIDTHVRYRTISDNLSKQEYKFLLTTTLTISVIEKYKNSDLKELSRFASGLEKDLSAVENAVASPLSNGFVEGTNSKLKMIKRTMYGRCGKELLAAKLILSNG